MPDNGQGCIPQLHRLFRWLAYDFSGYGRIYKLRLTDLVALQLHNIKVLRYELVGFRDVQVTKIFHVLSLISIISFSNS